METDIDEEEGEEERSSYLEKILLSRPVLKPYQGPSLPELASSALKLMSKSQDFSYLLAECGRDDEMDPTSLVSHVKAQMSFRPSLANFTLVEVLESFLSQRAAACLEAEDDQGLLRLARLVEALGPQVGLDMRGVLAERQTGLTEVTRAEVSLALHTSGLLSLAEQLRSLSPASLTLLISDLLSQSQHHGDLGLGLVKAGMSLASSDDQKAGNFLRSLLLHICDNVATDWRLSWLEWRDEKWARHSLDILLSQAQSGDLLEAVRSHRAWDTSTHSGLGSMMLAVVRSFSQVEPVYQLMSDVVLRSRNINWKLCCLCVTVCAEENPQSSQVWQQQLSLMLSKAVAEEERERLQGTLLLARHSAASPRFLNYNAWLASSLSEESPLITGTTRRGHRFLVSCLAELVPHQSLDALRDHLECRAGLARLCGDQWKDYEALMRSRRLELAGGEVCINTDKVTEQDLALVKTFIQHFARTKNISSKLTEMINFKKPLFDRQIVPALLTVELSSEEESARDGLLKLLTEKNKVGGHLYQKFKAGELRQEVAGADQDSTEDTIVSLLEVLSVLEQADTQQIRQLCKRLSSALTGLLEPFACDITLDKITKRDCTTRTDLPGRVHRKVWEKIVEMRNFSGDILSVLTCCSAMRVRTLQYLLELEQDDSHTEHIHLPLCQILVDTGRDQVEVGEGRRLSAVEMMCSRYHTVNHRHQLGVVENILTNIRPDPGVRRKYLENRRQLMLGGDCLHHCEGLSDLTAVLELELSIKIPGDRTRLVQSSLAMFDLSRADSNQLARLVESLVAVSSYTNNTEAVRAILQTLPGLVRRKVWLEVFRLTADRHSDSMLAVWAQLPGISLSAGDLNSLLQERREESRLCLSLEVTRFVLQTVSVAEVRRSKVAELSVRYWAARRHLASPDWLGSPSSSSSSIQAWSDCSQPASVRLGVLIVAETLLTQPDSLVWSLPDHQHPVLTKLKTLETKYSWTSLEDQLASLPGLWWPEAEMSDKLETACSLVIIHLATKVFSPTTTFIINNVLLLLSKVMESQLDCIPDYNINQLLIETLTLIKSQPSREISSLLRNIKFSIQSDIKDLLNDYL